MDLRSTQLKDTYGNLVTIGSVAGAPTTGTLQNGQGADITALDVAGTITSDGLTVDGTATLGASSSDIFFADSFNSAIRTPASAGHFYIQTANGAKTLAQFEDNNDISFYNSTGTNQAFYWDASAGSLGIGTTSPSTGLHVEQSGTDISIISRNTNNNASVATSSSLKLGITSTVGTHDSEIKVVEGAVNSNTTRMEFYNHFGGTSYKNMQILGNGDITFYDDTGVTPAFFWDASAESLGIGTTSPAVELDVVGTIRGGIANKKGTYTDGDTTPSVAGISSLRIANTGATTITDFDDAVEGQIIYLEFADSNTTIDRSNAYLSGGTNFTSTANDMLVLFYSSSTGNWLEISRSVNS